MKNPSDKDLSHSFNLKLEQLSCKKMLKFA